MVDDVFCQIGAAVQIREGSGANERPHGPGSVVVFTLRLQDPVGIKRSADLGPLVVIEDGDLRCRRAIWGPSRVDGLECMRGIFSGGGIKYHARLLPAPAKSINGVGIGIWRYAGRSFSGLIGAEIAGERPDIGRGAVVDRLRQVGIASIRTTDASVINGGIRGRCIVLILVRAARGQRDLRNAAGLEPGKAGGVFI